MTDRKLTIKETMQVTGKSEKTIRRYLKSGKLTKHFNNGINLIDFDELIDLGLVQTEPEIEPDVMTDQNTDRVSDQGDQDKFKINFQTWNATLLELGQLKSERDALRLLTGRVEQEKKHLEERTSALAADLETERIGAATLAGHIKDLERSREFSELARARDRKRVKKFSSVLAWFLFD